MAALSFHDLLQTLEEGWDNYFESACVKLRLFRFGFTQTFEFSQKSRVCTRL